jgi:uncharacterized NAD-dependent epimerase/dehydratase family protein
MTKNHTGNAIVLTGGLLSSNYAKTAHGLARGSDRFRILGIIDEKDAGISAPERIPNALDIPVYANVEDFLLHSSEKADYCIIGIAARGGRLPMELRREVEECLSRGISLVNGLHQSLSDDPTLASLAHQNGAEIIDIRKPKPFEELHFWNGSIKEVKSVKIAVLGTDCAVGKRTTSRILAKALEKEGVKAEMIYTGQTGWMQGSKYGFIFDATLNDFISGELEAAMVACYKDLKPDIMFIEGQSSLRNPSGPCGAEMILSGDAKKVILQVMPNRTRFKGLDDYPAEVPKPADEIDLINRYGAEVMAVTVNTQGINRSAAESYAVELEKILGIPVILPLEQGVDRLLPLLKSLIPTHENQAHSH